MNEDFFSTFRESPRPEFTQSLYKKLTQDAKARPFLHQHSTAKRLGFAIAALSLTFALTLLVSPSLRVSALAAVDDIIAKIMVRGATVFVSDNPQPSAPPEEFESYSVIWTPVTPDEISADYAFFARLPTWVPPGYVLQERVALYYLDMYSEPSSALFEWKDSAGEIIQLDVMKGSCPNGPVYESGAPRSDCTLSSLITVGIESEPQVSSIHEQPALLFRGVSGFADLTGSVRTWNPSRRKPSDDRTKGLWMVWENDGRTFWLAAESARITKEDLIRLAESIP